MTKFIGIFGQKNVGKTTLARMLTYELNKYFKEKQIYDWVDEPTGFAYPIKEMLSNMTGLPLYEIERLKNEDTILPGWSCTVRQALQKLGQCGREIHPECWINQRMKISNGYEIIDDGRHLNEVDAIIKAGGYIIIITRPGYDNKDGHESERGIDLIKDRYFHSGEHMNQCLLIDNCSTIEALKEVTQKALIPHMLTHFGVLK